jgi:hypothetical protein
MSDRITERHPQQPRGCSPLEGDFQEKTMSERLYKGGSTTMKSLLLVVGFAIFALIPAALFAQGKPPSCDGAEVTSSLRNQDDNYLDFQLQSDNQGPYTTLTNSRTDSVSSIIQGGSCDWVLDLSNSQNRKIRLTLAYPFSGSPTAPFTGTANVAARIISKCWKNTANNGISYGGMTYANQTLECAFSARFDYNGNAYAVRMDPSDYSGTTWVKVTCTGAALSQCNSWSVTPIPGVFTNSLGQSSAIGELVRITTKGKTVETPLGLYYVDFSALITKP